jgi:hypothetical protein
MHSISIDDVSVVAISTSQRRKGIKIRKYRYAVVVIIFKRITIALDKYGGHWMKQMQFWTVIRIRASSTDQAAWSKAGHDQDLSGTVQCTAISDLHQCPRILFTVPQVVRLPTFQQLFKVQDLSWPPLWSSGQSSWLQIQRSGFDSPRYQISLEVVGLERGPLSLVSITEQLLERKSSGSGLEDRHYNRRDPSRWPRGTLYPQKSALTSPTSGGRSVDRVRSRTKATELFIIVW